MGNLRLTGRGKRLRDRTRQLTGAAAAWLGATAGRARRLTGLTISRLGYTAGCATTSAGVGLNFGLGWALTLGGVVCAVSFLLLVDVESKGDDHER